MSEDSKEKLLTALIEQLSKRDKEIETLKAKVEELANTKPAQSEVTLSLSQLQQINDTLDKAKGITDDSEAKKLLDKVTNYLVYGAQKGIWTEVV